MFVINTFEKTKNTKFYNFCFKDSQCDNDINQ
jgi:hypothetical protein